MAFGPKNLQQSRSAAGNGYCGSERQKAATALTAFFLSLR
jgi:hypothetical protein